MQNPPFQNPFKPGAGHMPPHLAGREEEIAEFVRLLEQTTILENVVLTGLRGVGKTVLLETLKPIAIREDWLWVGTDLSEASSLTEANLATRLLTDLSVVTSSIVLSTEERQKIGFSGESLLKENRLGARTLTHIFNETPGLVADKIKATLEIAWEYLAKRNPRGIIFAYDEAQNLADHARRDQFPLSLLLDVFQSIQKKDIPMMLVLTGLPMLFPKLVDARTFAERMFHIITLDRLNDSASSDAILIPIHVADCPVKFDDSSVAVIIKISAGYPYFIQFICRDVYDVFIQQAGTGENMSVPVREIHDKLDSDFFAGRWSRASDRQRELLSVAASLENSDSEFTIQDIVEHSREILQRDFSSSNVNQMLAKLCEMGLVYKNRHGKYSFAVPLLDRFIRRQMQQDDSSIQTN